VRFDGPVPDDAHTRSDGEQVRELTVLNDLARRLATLRASEEVLQEVTAQARRLLAVDVAYIMLRSDGTTESGARLRIEVVEGSMGSVMRGIELEPGEGLGGRVLATGRPIWSRDYLRDSTIPHLASLDDAATSEQLHGILGVPLVLGADVIGVLLAADRHPRDFARRDVELLAALASHAAVAIHNASLFEQNRAALEELREVNADLRRSHDVREQLSDLSERLTTTVINGGSVADIAAQLEQALGRPVAVHGAAHEHLAGAPADDLVGLVGEDGLARIEDAAASPAPLRLDAADGGEVVVVPVRLRTGYAGCLVARDLPGEDDVRQLAVGGTAMALVVSSERALAEAELRTRGELVNALLAPDADAASVRRRARAAGIDLDRIRLVAVLDAGPSSESSATARLAARTAQRLHGWSAEYRDHHVLLLPTGEADDVVASLTGAGESGLPCAVGLAACTGGSQDVRRAHRLARQTATVLHALGRGTEAAQPSDLGPYRALFSEAGRTEVAAFVRRVVGPVLAYDRERGRDIGATLLAYLENAQHHGRTCAVLHVHANTLYQRLERAGELLGPGWRAPGRALDVELALRLASLLPQGTDPPPRTSASGDATG
jgi:hypothetical protein